LLLSWHYFLVGLQILFLEEFNYEK